MKIFDPLDLHHQTTSLMFNDLNIIVSERALFVGGRCESSANSARVGAKIEILPKDFLDAGSRVTIEITAHQFYGK